MAILRNPEAKNAIVMTIDHLCLPAWQQKIAVALDLPTTEMPDVDVSKMRHTMRRDLTALDPQLRLLWDRWQWLVLRTQPGTGLHPWEEGGQIPRVTC